jgi:hypothetical protein
MGYLLRYRYKGDKRDWMNLEIANEIDCHKRDARDIAKTTMIINPDIVEVIIIKRDSKGSKKIVVKNPDRKD